MAKLGKATIETQGSFSNSDLITEESQAWVQAARIKYEAR